MEKLSLITGANSGIGKETAVGLARKGFAVVMACRNRQKGEAALRDVRLRSGSSSVELMMLDLADLSSVRRLAAEFLDTHRRLDVLINNAGVILTKRSVTVDGFETTFQVNYLSHFLLTRLLLDRVEQSSPSRIVNVSSRAHFRGSIHFDDLQCSRGYSAFKSYGQSKLAQVLFTYELARRLAGTGVDVNCVHPGSVASRWGRGKRDWLSFGLAIASVFETRPEKAAETTIMVASDPSLQGVTGRYFANRKESRSSSRSHDMETARRLWDVSCHLLGMDA